MTRAVSIKQMVNRSNDGHRRALRLYDDDVTLPLSTPVSTLRGLRTCISTLIRWGCLEGTELTDSGRELLAALDERHDRSAERMRTR